MNRLTTERFAELYSHIVDGVDIPLERLPEPEELAELFRLAAIGFKLDQIAVVEETFIEEMRKCLPPLTPVQKLGLECGGVYKNLIGTKVELKINKVKYEKR